MASERVDLAERCDLLLIGLGRVRSREDAIADAVNQLVRKPGADGCAATRPAARWRHRYRH